MKAFLICLSLLLLNAGNLSAVHSPEFVKLEQKIVNILKTSWCSEEKARLILEHVVTHRPKICVEIGPFTGSSTLPLLAGLQYLNHGYAYVIDAWSNSEAIRWLPKEDPNAVWWGSLNMRAIKNQFIQTMDQWSLTPYFQVLHMSSQKAAAQIPGIDFLHLDGNFSEEGALLDTQLYLPKVVPNGHILISNVLIMIGNRPPKMKALWPLFEQCEIVCEIENGNAFLFRKK
jgi:hypothetical protein